MTVILVSYPSLAAEAERLPSEVKPVSYDLALVPDAGKLTFSGRAQIVIEVSTPVPAIVLNEDGLTLDEAVLDGSSTATAIRTDSKLQRAAVSFNQPAAAGRHRLAIAYHGPITQDGAGFFAMDYSTATGPHRTLATFFEPAQERRFMSSWDEPALKSTFRLTVDMPSDGMAVSNMPVESTEILDPAHKRVHFATSRQCRPICSSSRSAISNASRGSPTEPMSASSSNAETARKASTRFLKPSRFFITTTDTSACRSSSEARPHRRARIH